MKYDPHAIEAKWRDTWPLERESYRLAAGDAPYYVLDMISYPSSEGLHMGHWRPYTIADVWARYQTMRGQKVLSPVGFDAFGLPAENAAIKNQTPPVVYTKNAIANFSRQIKQMGKMYDWSTRLDTSDPNYYKWTQWLFIELYRVGLAYRAFARVNWCPSDQTVLANEQVIAGRCERCGAAVVKKNLKQWFFKITDFAEDLLHFDGLNWPTAVKTLQTNWIGKSEGAEIEFALADFELSIKVFTTRVDTLFGATYLVLAPEHALVEKITTAEKWPAVTAYARTAGQKSDIERLAVDKTKTGVFTGAYVINPINDEKIPVWVADYVLGTYGTGAIMAVPAHDARDFAFAQVHGLPVRPVVKPLTNIKANFEGRVDDGEGGLTDSGPFSGQTAAIARRSITEALTNHGRGRSATTYRLRDWLVSRQRYWGAPIPIIYCDICGEQAVPTADLPVRLPPAAEFLPTGGSPLEHDTTFKLVNCPKCAGPATRETDTLDTFVDSSWYFLRFADPKNATAAFGSEQVKKWLPVDFYVGGTEHSILHLLYARFMTKALCRMGHIDFSEPFTTFYGNGMIYLNGAKMSKSKGNVINPDDVAQKFGSDALRGYILFMGPANQDVEWQTNGIVGIARFLQKVWQTFGVMVEGQTIRPALAETVSELTLLLENKWFNRCISRLMICLRAVKRPPLNRAEGQVLARLLAPFFPHLGEELWQTVGGKGSVFVAGWPEARPIGARQTTYVVQIDGQARSTVTLPVDSNEATVVAAARSVLAVAKRLESKAIARTVFVAGRAVNFVLK